MSHHNSAVYDVVELDQVMIDAFWQKYRYPYAHFSESNSGLKTLDLAKVYSCLKTDSLCHCVAVRISLP